jgi:hypothetical protein
VKLEANCINVTPLIKKFCSNCPSIRDRIFFKALPVTLKTG